MKRKIEIGGSGDVSEVAIVDTFTKLIFGQESEYSECELQIIQALRHIDAIVAVDNFRDIGVYLRALGVREMIALVSKVRLALHSGLPHCQFPSEGMTPGLHSVP